MLHAHPPHGSQGRRLVLPASERAAVDVFSASERSLLKNFRGPQSVQRFLDIEVAYNKEPGGPTCRSPRAVLRERVAHCMEGALFAAAALRFQGHPPLLLDLEAVRDDDHVLALFREHGHWGAIAKSNYSGLRFREPVYRTLRELVLSYFEHYYNLKGEKTLRAYSRPVRLTRFDRLGWMTSASDVWVIPEYLCEIRHVPLLPDGMDRRLSRMDKRMMEAGLVGSIR
jgi:hypothetical protein